MGEKPRTSLTHRVDAPAPFPLKRSHRRRTLAWRANGQIAFEHWQETLEVDAEDLRGISRA